MTQSAATSTEFRIIFGVGHEGGAQGDRLHKLEGLTPEDLRELSEETGAHVTTSPGSVGVGAAGPGIELILAYGSIPGDIVGTIELGRMLKKVIEKIRSYRATRTPTISDRDTMAAVAAASVSGAIADRLMGTRLRSVKNLSGGEPPNWNGTASWHLWAVVFENETQGYSVVIFMSPSGVVLGATQVPLEDYWDGTTWQHRTSEDIASFGRS